MIQSKVENLEKELRQSRQREGELRRQLLQEQSKSKTTFDELRQHYKPPRAPPAYLAKAIDWACGSPVGRDNNSCSSEPQANQKRQRASSEEVDEHAVSAMADLRRLAIALQLPHTTIVSTKVGWVCYTLCQPIGTDEDELQYARAFFSICNPLLPMVDPPYCRNILKLLKREKLLNALEEEGLFENDGRKGAPKAVLEAQKHFNAAGERIAKDMMTTVEELRKHGFTVPRRTSQFSAAETQAVYDLDEFGLPKHDAEKAHDLLKAPQHSIMPFFDDSPESFTRQTPAAASALLNGILAIGARLNMHHDRASVYAERARVCSACGLDVPRLAMVSGLLLQCYYRVGSSERGELSQAKLYVALASEMAHSITSRSAPKIDDENINSSPLDCPDNNNEWVSHPAPLTEGGEYLPPNVGMACKVLAQITAVSRNTSFCSYEQTIMHNPSSSIESPRLRMTGILTFVGLKLRHRSAKDLSRWSGVLSSALQEAERLLLEHEIGAAMKSSFLVQLHACKATLYFNCGDIITAGKECDSVFEALNSPFRLYGGYVDTASVVMLIPVLVSCNREHKVSFILHVLQERAKIWPLAKLLVAKAKRRIEYCKRAQPTGAAESSSSQQRSHVMNQRSMPSMERTGKRNGVELMAHSTTDEFSDMRSFQAYVENEVGSGENCDSSACGGPFEMSRVGSSSSFSGSIGSVPLDGLDTHFGLPDFPLLGMDFDDFSVEDM